MVRKDSLPVAETNSMDRDEIEKKLQKLALEIKQYPPTNSRNKLQRRRILTEFNTLVMSSGILEVGKQKLRRKYLGTLASNQLFDECYREALQKVWLEIDKNISEYKPEKSKILNWFYSTILEYRFIDTKNEYLKIRKPQRDSKKLVVLDESVDKPIKTKQGGIENNSNTYQDLLESTYIEDNILNSMQEFKRLMIQDPWQIFSGKHLKNNPNLNYQTIAIHRLNNASWDEIAAIANEKIGTVTPFFSRNHLFFKPFIYEYLQGEFKLSKQTQELIGEDRGDKFKRIKMKDYSEITLHSVMLDKINGKSWQAMATQWKSGVEVQLVIYFYLKTIKRLDKIFKDEFNLDF